MLAAGASRGWLPAAGLPDVESGSGLRAVQGGGGGVCCGADWGTMEGSRVWEKWGGRLASLLDRDEE
jgi:hypothetical protein